MTSTVRTPAAMCQACALFHVCNGCQWNTGNCASHTDEPPSIFNTIHQPSQQLAYKAVRQYYRISWRSIGTTVTAESEWHVYPAHFPSSNQRFDSISSIDIFKMLVCSLPERKTRQFREKCNAPTCVWFCYLFNGICFHFHLCVKVIPADLHFYAALTVTALIGLVTMTFDFLTFRFTGYACDGLPYCQFWAYCRGFPFSS